MSGHFKYIVNDINNHMSKKWSHWILRLIDVTNNGYLNIAIFAIHFQFVPAMTYINGS